MEKQEQKEGLGVTPAKVIEGWVDPTARTDYDVTVYPCQQTDANGNRVAVPATLVIGEKAWPESKVRELSEQLEDARGLLSDVAHNYDCDTDGHKYNTGCRACQALAFLLRTKPTDIPTPTT